MVLNGRALKNMREYKIEMVLEVRPHAITELAMKTGERDMHSNGVSVCVDWLSWTLTEPCTVESAIQLMGYSMADFQLLPQGRNGYRSQLHHSIYPISVQYDGHEGMGIHVDVSGSDLGSRVSNLMIRVYDKQLEQNKKLRETGKPLITYPWVRWELELKDKNAVMASQLLIQGKSVNAVTIGILSNYLRIIILDSSRKTRCSTDPVWELFISDVKKLALY